ncbi:hypothetical protein D3C81_1304240 [compost metagenome]
MIALEIDGKQHNEQNRLESDLKKDNFLASKNWKVYRIKWKNINNQVGKDYMLNEINKFLTFYNEC